jgi:hypothetical protein
MRIAAGFFISTLETVITASTSPELNSHLNQLYTHYRGELDKVPEVKADLKGAFDTYEKTVVPKLEKIMDDKVAEIAPFIQERSAGRPPQPKAGPGRPKE